MSNIKLQPVDMTESQPIIIFICICAFLAIVVLVIAVYRQFKLNTKSKELNKRVEFWLSEKGALSGSLVEDAEKNKREREESFSKRVLLPLSQQMGSWMAEKSDYTEQNAQRLALIKAGMRDKNALYAFYGIKIGLAILCLIGFTSVFSVISGFVIALGIGSVAAAFGFILPKFAVDSMANTRQANIDSILPDALDLLVICTEAGMGIDQALLKVASNIGPRGKDLVEEVILTNREMALGQSRLVCWKNLGERTNSEELKSLSNIISQAEQRGGQVARILREQADFMRLRRRQAAEEKAAQLTVKMMIPMALFIFPVIMCVTLGPPMVKLATNFSKN